MRSEVADLLAELTSPDMDEETLTEALDIAGWMFQKAVQKYAYRAGEPDHAPLPASAERLHYMYPDRHLTAEELAEMVARVAERRRYHEETPRLERIRDQFRDFLPEGYAELELTTEEETALVEAVVRHFGDALPLAGLAAAAFRYTHHFEVVPGLTSLLRRCGTIDDHVTNQVIFSLDTMLGWNALPKDVTTLEQKEAVRAAIAALHTVAETELIRDVSLDVRERAAETIAHIERNLAKVLRDAPRRPRRPGRA